MAHDVKATMDGTLLNWLKNVGDSVKVGDIIAEVEADKATVEVEAGAEGVITSHNVQPGAEITEGMVIAVIGSASAAPEAAPAAKTEASAPKAEAPAQPSPAVRPTAANGSSSTTAEGRVKASPLARNIAAERGIDIRQVAGSGPGGRIVKRDVEQFTPAAQPTVPKSGSAPASGAFIAATYGKLPENDVEIIEVSRLRARIAENTVLSKQQIPHFYVTVEMDAEPLLALRAELNKGLEGDGVKISVNDMIVKATALALRKFPNLNSHFYGDKIVRHQRIHIGIAVPVPGGLMNVVSHDADKTTLSVMAKNHKEMIARAKDGKVKPDDIRGATFTVSNLGVFDVEHFIAVINPPEAGILAVGAARKVPIVRPDGSLGVGTRMKVTISVDHRVSDGAEGTEYLMHLRDLIENPMRLLI